MSKWGQPITWLRCSRIDCLLRTLEAMNSLVRPAKIRACGYGTTKNLITMAYLVCGTLIFSLPT